MDRKGSDVTLRIGVRIHWKISRWKLAYLPHSTFNFCFSNSKCYSWSKTCSKLHDAWHLRAHENVKLKCNKIFWLVHSWNIWLNCRWLLYLTGTPLGHSSLFWAWHSLCTEGSTSKFFVNVSCIYLCFTITPALYIFVWFQEINSILYQKSYNFFPAQGKCWGSNSRFFNNYQA